MIGGNVKNVVWNYLLKKCVKVMGIIARSKTMSDKVKVKEPIALPIKKQQHSYWSNLYDLVDAIGNVIAKQLFEPEADFIVLCCNSHRQIGD